MRMFFKYGFLISCWSAILFSVSGHLMAAPELNKVIETVKSSSENSVKSQKKINALSDKARKLYDEYRLTVQEKESLEIYNNHVETLIQSQQKEFLALQKQLDEVDVTGREIVPLMLRMLDSLERFVSLDVPFLKEERTKRLADLRDMMGRADVTVAEQYRRIMEAYLIELEFGRTIEAYESQLESDGKVRSVSFLRIGRLMLAYQTPDKQEMGVWNNNTRKWDSLDDGYSSSITKGLRIARKQAAPDLIRLPLPSPGRVQ